MINTLYKTSFDTPIGKVFCIYATEKEIAFLGNNTKSLEVFVRAVKNELGSIKIIEEPCESIKKGISGFLEGKKKSTGLEAIFLTGTGFDKKVWQATSRVPYGSVATYKYIASMTGNPDASRAVGNSLSKNPVFLIIPCHRIIKSDGSIGGFSSGLGLKRKLLSLEGISI